MNWAKEKQKHGDDSVGLFGSKIKDEDITYTLIKNAIENIKEMIVAEEFVFEDRKLFERKETTDKLKSYLIRNHDSLITNKTSL
ncbi:hypothetical protein [Neobacillus cucumis]|uniref:hypothetical protein n=1 Tax=Neobacillus cucumis TaxID=1740721 RepID=UPI001965DA23|nr:hypothetical protein [Neobacillus cucumis]MBM7651347.1 hypothetical protein [Neobacillus cucumis]